MTSRSRAPIAFMTPISLRRSRTAARSALAMPRAAIARATTPMAVRMNSITCRYFSTDTITSSGALLE